MAVKINPVQVQKFLDGLDYPATKAQIADHAEQHGADQDILEVIGRLPDREYESSTEVNREISRIE